MIRPTTARIDLDALQSNYRHIVDFLAREPRAAGRPAPGSKSADRQQGHRADPDEERGERAEITVEWKSTSCVHSPLPV